MVAACLSFLISFFPSFIIITHILFKSAYFSPKSSTIRLPLFVVRYLFVCSYVKGAFFLWWILKFVICVYFLLWQLLIYVALIKCGFTLVRIPLKEDDSLGHHKSFLLSQWLFFLSFIFFSHSYLDQMCYSSPSLYHKNVIMFILWLNNFYLDKLKRTLYYWSLSQLTSVILDIVNRRVYVCTYVWQN